MCGARDWCWVSFSSTFHVILLSRGLSLSSELGSGVLDGEQGHRSSFLLLSAPGSQVLTSVLFFDTCVGNTKAGPHDDEQLSNGAIVPKLTLCLVY